MTTLADLEDNEDFEILCDIGITNDVIVYLKGSGVEKILREIKDLEKAVR